MKNVKIEKVFTPGSPAELTFIDRPKPDKQIRRALRNKGIQVIVYGHSGSGKTTLLYNLLKLLEHNHITTRCTKGMSIKEILYDGFSQLGTFYTTQKEKKTEDKVSAGFKFGLEFFGINANTDTGKSKANTMERIVEIQKNPNLLAKLFGASNCLWVIEDFHKLDSEPKKELSQIMKVFMDVASSFSLTKIIAIGAVDSARQVVHLDDEMENRVSEVNVTLMTPDELYEIIQLGENHLNIVIEDNVQEKIVAYSSGLASVTHTLCSLACENKDVFETQIKKVIITEDDLEYAVSEYINGKSDSLKSIYEQATKEKSKRKFEPPIKLLTAILNLDKINFSILDISDELSKTIKNYKSNNLRKYVMEFTTPERGEILKYNKNGDIFSFSNPFIRGYCHIQIEQNYSKKKRPNRSISKEDLLHKYLNDQFHKFILEINTENNWT